MDNRGGERPVQDLMNNSVTARNKSLPKSDFFPLMSSHVRAAHTLATLGSDEYTSEVKRTSVPTAPTRAPVLGEKDLIAREQQAFKQFIAQQEAIISDIESDLAPACESLTNYKAKILQVPLGPVDEGGRAIQQEEVLLREAAKELTLALRKEKENLKKIEQAYLLKITDLAKTIHAKKTTLMLLKKNLAQALRAWIEEQCEGLRRSPSASHKEQLAKFNQQFLSYFQINLSTEELMVRPEIRKDFAKQALLEIQSLMVKLLTQINSTQPDNLRSLTRMLTSLLTHTEFQSFRAQGGRGAAFEVNGVEFLWGPTALSWEEEVAEASIKKKILSLKEQYSSAIQVSPLQARRSKLKEQLKEYKEENRDYQSLSQVLDPAIRDDLFFDLKDHKGEKPGEDLESAAYKGFIHSINALNEKNPAIKFSHVLPEQGRLIFESVNHLGRDLVKLKERPISVNEKRLSSMVDLQLHVEAAKASYDLLEQIQKIQGFYPGGGLPEPVSLQLTEAFETQGALIRSLINPTREESKYNMDECADLGNSDLLLGKLNRQVNALSASLENVLSAQLCRLLIDTLKNHPYWHRELFSACGGELVSSPKGRLHIPTGVKQMNDIVDRYNSLHAANWFLNPETAKTFLCELKAGASRRLANKWFCGLFNTFHSAHTLEFYQFLDRLDLGQLPTALTVAKSLNSVRRTREEIQIQNVEPRRTIGF